MEAPSCDLGLRPGPRSENGMGRVVGVGRTDPGGAQGCRVEEAGRADKLQHQTWVSKEGPPWAAVLAMPCL